MCHFIFADTEIGQFYLMFRGLIQVFSLAFIKSHCESATFHINHFNFRNDCQLFCADSN